MAASRINESPRDLIPAWIDADSELLNHYYRLLEDICDNSAMPQYSDPAYYRVCAMHADVDNTSLIDDLFEAADQCEMGFGMGGESL